MNKLEILAPMSKDEMNAYLESIGGLVRLYVEDKRLIVDTTYLGVKTGWYSIVKELTSELINLGWDREVVQIKEKMGGLRFYVSTLPKGGDSIISKYEALSYNTCEVCGKHGLLRGGNWYKTLCDEHSEGKEPLNKVKTEEESAFTKHLKIKFPNVDVDKVLKIFDAEVSSIELKGMASFNPDLKFPLKSALVKNIIIKVIDVLNDQD
jgi:hypothetical protein